MAAKKNDVSKAVEELKEVPLSELTEGPQEDPVLDAVIVVKERGQDGGIATRIMVNGNVEATEVQTLLELGVRGWREQIGLV